MRPRPEWQRDPDPYVRYGTDIVPLATRRRIMQSIPSKGNRSTELVMGEKLGDAGLLEGVVRHARVLGSMPDFVWPELKMALFVDGCFWHGCPRHYREPSSNGDLWRGNVEYRRRRDSRIRQRLRRAGWAVMRVWECRVNDAATICRIVRKIQSRVQESYNDTE